MQENETEMRGRVRTKLRKSKKTIFNDRIKEKLRRKGSYNLTAEGAIRRTDRSRKQKRKELRCTAAEFFQPLSFQFFLITLLTERQNLNSVK